MLVVISGLVPRFWCGERASIPKWCYETFSPEDIGRRLPMSIIVTVIENIYRTCFCSHRVFPWLYEGTVSCTSHESNDILTAIVLRPSCPLCPPGRNTARCARFCDQHWERPFTPGKTWWALGKCCMFLWPNSIKVSIGFLVIRCKTHSTIQPVVGHLRNVTMVAARNSGQQSPTGE